MFINSFLKNSYNGYSLFSRTLLLLAVGTLSACGGGGDDSGPQIASGVAPWQQGVFQDASLFAAQCAVPRTGVDANGDPVPDTQGTTEDEKNFLRSWSNDTYLWYDEVTDVDPNGSHTTSEYFDLLITNETIASGRPKDNPSFHFSVPTDDWIMQSQSGVSAGYGIKWMFFSNGVVIVPFLEPGSPADVASLQRGEQIISIDGENLINGTGNANIINDGLFPSTIGETHQFTVRDLSGITRAVTLTSSAVTSTPVPVVTTVNTGSGLVGYLLFNSHIATAEEGLVDAINQLNTNSISDLVLDLRYNSGGTLIIASQLAYMIAGAGSTMNEVFETPTFNDKHPTIDPVTGNPITSMTFIDQTLGLGALTAGQPLPTLNLPRVFVLTGSNTCSASESIINGLRGVDVEVIQIGSTTCGKPYGFYPQDNCGETYFSIQVKGENAKGFGDFPDGFTPDNASGFGVKVTGCSVHDDFDHQLGDPNEGRFEAALNFRAIGSCPPPTGAGRGSTARALSGEVRTSDGVIQQPLWLQNKILDPTI